MKPFQTINDIHDFAIERELEAVDFYRELSANCLVCLEPRPI